MHMHIHTCVAEAQGMTEFVRGSTPRAPGPPIGVATTAAHAYTGYNNERAPDDSVARLQ